MVENKDAGSVAAVVMAVEPVATTVAAAWDFVLFFVSCLTWERDDWTPKKPVFVWFIVLTFVI